MNAPQDPRSLLLARLGSLVGCARAEGYACITARHEHGAHAVDIDHPCIAIVLRGRKQVRTHAQALEFAPGDLFLIARRCRMDVTNIPDPDSGLYLTVTIPLCEEVLAAARLLWTDPISGRGDDLARLVDHPRRDLGAADVHADGEHAVPVLCWCTGSAASPGHREGAAAHEPVGPHRMRPLP